MKLIIELDENDIQVKLDEFLGERIASITDEFIRDHVSAIVDKKVTRAVTKETVGGVPFMTMTPKEEEDALSDACQEIHSALAKLEQITGRRVQDLYIETHDMTTLGSPITQRLRDIRISLEPFLAISPWRTGIDEQSRIDFPGSIGPAAIDNGVPDFTREAQE